METIDYDQLPNFGGFDGHTDRIPTVWHGIESPFGDAAWSSRIPRLSDAILADVKRQEKEILDQLNLPAPLEPITGMDYALGNDYLISTDGGYYISRR